MQIIFFPNPKTSYVRFFFDFFNAKNLTNFLVFRLGILKILRESAMERFLTTPFEEREKAEQSKSLNARLSSNQSVISKLEKELADVIAERDGEVS